MDKMRKDNLKKYEKITLKLGAIKVANGIYKLNEWFLYPTKGFAMHRMTYEKISLDSFINITNIRP